MALTKEQITGVKGRGFLRNRGTDCFSGRVVSIGGVFSADALTAIAACAEKFGSGSVVFTSRMSAEIVGIPYESIPAAEAFLAKHGLYFGGTGAKIRPIVACKGTTCVYGNIDTQGMARILHEKFYLGMRDVRLPHKFKIAVGGCPNSCMKPSLNDVGVEGCRVFEFDAEKCRGCTTCPVAAACPSKAIARTDDGKASPNPDKCTHCGVCIGKCPFGATPTEAKSACRIYVGGTWGKTWRIGTRLPGVYAPEDVPGVIEEILLWYKENGFAGERLGLTIDRLGMDALCDALASGTLSARRDEILRAPLRQN